MGLKPPSPGTGNCFLLTVTDKYSRFSFAFTLRSITLTTVISRLRHLLSVFGYPSFIHTDRVKQFSSNEFQQFCQENGIAHSQSTPYHPVGNGLCERMNGTIWKAVCCLLEFCKLPASHWESVLCEAFSAIRTLLCTAANKPPHDRLFQFQRKEGFNYYMPAWIRAGANALLRIFVRKKCEPLVT